MRVPHEELTPQEVAEKARHWAGILLGRPLVPNTIDPDWGRVRQLMEQSRWTGCREVDLMLANWDIRQNAARAVRAEQEAAQAEGRVWDARTLPPSITRSRHYFIDPQTGETFVGVITNDEFWAAHGERVYEYAVWRMGENPAHWREVARRVWEHLSEEQRRQVACQ